MKGLGTGCHPCPLKTNAPDPDQCPCGSPFASSEIVKSLANQEGSWQGGRWGPTHEQFSANQYLKRHSPPPLESKFAGAVKLVLFFWIMHFGIQVNLSHF